MSTIKIYTSDNCWYCDQAKRLLDGKDATYEEIDVSNNPEILQEKCPGQRTVPQIFINSEYIGGFDDLNALQQSGELDKKLRDHSKEASTDSTQNNSSGSDSTGDDPKDSDTKTVN